MANDKVTIPSDLFLGMGDHAADLLGNLHRDDYADVVSRAAGATASPVMGAVPRTAMGPSPSLVPFQRMSLAAPAQTGIPMRSSFLGRVQSVPDPSTPMDMTRPILRRNPDGGQQALPVDSSMGMDSSGASSVGPGMSAVAPAAPVHHSFLGKVGGILGKIGEIAGSAVIPNEMQWIPGTTQHNILEESLKEKQAQAGADVAREGAQADFQKQQAADLAQKMGEEPERFRASQADVESQTKQREQLGEAALAKANRPEDLSQLEAQVASDRIKKGEDPNKVLGDIYEDRLKGQKPSEGDKPIGDATTVNSTNTALGNRYQVLHPGKALPAEYTLPANATQRDFDRVDKLMQQEEGAASTKAQQDAAREARAQTTEIARQGLQDREDNAKQNREDKKTAEYNKNVAPIDAAKDYADTYLKNGVFTGPGDEALQEKFFELAKPSTGFRMSQPQMDMLQNSRDWMGSIAAHMRHATTGTWFSDEQRQQLVKTMGELAASKAKVTGGSFSSEAPARPTGVPADAKWDSASRHWVK